MKEDIKMTDKFNYKRLAFLPLDIPNPPKYIDYWNSLEYDELIRDDFRSCWHIPLMTRDGEWTKFAKEMPEFIEWYEKYINIRTRMMIITTPANTENAKHIDCSPDKFGNTVQHKLRYVFQGEVSSLTFCDGEKDKSVPEIDKPFCMDGAWPHYMINTTAARKYTLAIGAPWEPEEDDSWYVNLLKRSYEVYKDSYMSSENWILPDDYVHMYDPKYK